MEESVRLSQAELGKGNDVGSSFLVYPYGTPSWVELQSIIEGREEQYGPILAKKVFHQLTTFTNVQLGIPAIPSTATFSRACFAEKTL